MQAHFRTRLVLLALFSSLMLSAAPSASASNIVLDGGFEQADPSHTTLASTYYDTTTPDIGDGAWFVTEGAVGVFTKWLKYNYDGNKSIYLPGGDNGDGQLTQTLATTPGQAYLVSFWANSDDPENFIRVTFGGSAVEGIPSGVADNGFPSASGNRDRFTFYSGVAVASSTSTDLSFYGQSSFGAIMIDDVSVTAVPEPSTLTLAAFAGLAGLAGVRLRRGSQSA
jgi:hypothetical protein